MSSDHEQCISTLEDENCELRRRLDRMEDRLDHLEQKLAKKELRPVRAVAEEDNQWPDTYKGLKLLMERKGVPLRMRGGRIKPKGSQKVSYVSMYELRRGERIGTQSVQADAGLG